MRQLALEAVPTIKRRHDVSDAMGKVPLAPRPRREYKAPRASELRQARRELEVAQARFRAAACGTDPEAAWQAGERLYHARRKVARLGREQAFNDEPGVRRSSMTRLTIESQLRSR